MATSLSKSPSFELHYLTLRSVVSPEDQAAGRKRWCGIARADHLLDLGWDQNVRSYLGVDEEGKRRKPTAVNQAIRSTVDGNREIFPMLNAGLVIVARSAEADDSKRVVKLKRESIINGAQTMGVLKDYFSQRTDDTEFPAVNFELIATEDEELIADISIARNFQNRVEALSIYGRQGRFDELAKSLAKHAPSVRLRTKETDFGDEFLDTEKLIQVLTALTPRDVRLPSAEKRNTKTPETIYRVYAYRHRSRCLKDFAEVMDQPKDWSDAYQVFLDLAWDGWNLYQRLKGESFFSRLHCVKKVDGKVAPDGVPDGIVFPMISAMSRFVKKGRGGWKIDIPKTFPWNTLFRAAYQQETSVAKNNPQTMGKLHECYIALHTAIDMFFAATGGDDSLTLFEAGE